MTNGGLPHRRFRAVRREVCLAYTPLSVRGRLAISQVDEEEAVRTLEVTEAIPDAFATELGEEP